MHTDLMQVLRWMRMLGDMVFFAAGAVDFAYFALTLIFRPAKAETVIDAMPEAA